jgi:hypothetical protein
MHFISGIYAKEKEKVSLEAMKPVLSETEFAKVFIECNND